MPGPKTHDFASEWIAVDDPQLGRVLHILPVIPEQAPYPVREGIARRRIAALTGTCPCGESRAPLPPVPQGQVVLTEFPHDRRCPAITGTLVKAIRRWLR